MELGRAARVRDLLIRCAGQGWSDSGLKSGSTNPKDQIAKMMPNWKKKSGIPLFPLLLAIGVSQLLAIGHLITRFIHRGISESKHVQKTLST